MANARKLQGEIDRMMKKISEGFDTFEQIWDKVYAASQQSQKEKHEQDLKREIKKLQRFREQLKTWLGNPEVKDKRPLTEAKKLIELKMEQFRVCERETKTKAYSMEGLAQQDRLDPLEQSKLNTQDWIRDCLSQLQTQMEGFESDLERLNSAKNKKQAKAEIQQLEELNQKHKWHIQKLEQVNRKLDNNALHPNAVDQIREDLEYYLEANQVCFSSDNTLTRAGT